MDAINAQQQAIVCSWPEQRKRYVGTYPPSHVLFGTRGLAISIHLWSSKHYPQRPYPISPLQPNVIIPHPLQHLWSCVSLHPTNQRHRGPAKGYIEGLEHRLHEAETLLLQLLPVVTPDQLSAATATLATAGMRDSPEHMTGRSSPPVLNKKTGIDYWETFPLDTVENIRRWQADCAMHSQFRDELASTSRPGSRPGSIDLQREQIQPQPRKQSSMSQQPFRAMSTDSYSRSNHHTPTSQPEYMSQQIQTQPQRQQPQQQQQWANPGFVKADPSSAGYMQTGYANTNDQQWQQQQRQQNAYQQQQNQMQMEVDSGFFPSDMKRNLFW